MRFAFVDEHRGEFPVGLTCEVLGVTGHAMAARLASELAASTGAPAPQGVPPGAYLAAVVQERQAREVRRAFGGGTPGPAQVTHAWAPSPGAGYGPVAGVPGGYPYPGGQPATAPSPQPPVAYGSAAAPGAGGSGVTAAAGDPSEASRPAVPPEGRPASGFVPPA